MCRFNAQGQEVGGGGGGWGDVEYTLAGNTWLLMMMMPLSDPPVQSAYTAVFGWVRFPFLSAKFQLQHGAAIIQNGSQLLHNVSRLLPTLAGLAAGAAASE